MIKSKTFFRKKWRTRLQPIRTESEIAIKIIIQPDQRTPLYQKYSEKVKELSVLGMSLRAIGKSLKVSKRTVTKALEFQKGPKNDPGRQK